MFYVYLDHFYGTELIGTTKTYPEAEKIKAEKDKEWEKGFLWSTRITDRKEKEKNYFD